MIFKNPKAQAIEILVFKRRVSVVKRLDALVTQNYGKSNKNKSRSEMNKQKTIESRLSQPKNFKTMKRFVFKNKNLKLFNN